MSESKIKTIYVDPTSCNGEENEFAEYLENQYPGAEIVLSAVPAYPVRFADGTEEKMDTEEYDRLIIGLWESYCNS